MHTVTKNYGLAGGTLDAEKHTRLAADPAAYMRKLAQRPWATYFNATDETRTAKLCTNQGVN